MGEKCENCKFYHYFNVNVMPDSTSFGECSVLPPDGKHHATGNEDHCG